MIQGHPVVERYLTCVDSPINEFDFLEREEVTSEIRDHIAEAIAATECCSWPRTHASAGSAS